MVDDATDVCSLRHIFATFLANSSASFGRLYFYLIQSNGWKCLCSLTELSVHDYSKLLLQNKLVLVRNNKDALDQLGWIGTIGIPFWCGFNHEGTFTEGGAV
jgi:hypothetical protein